MGRIAIKKDFYFGNDTAFKTIQWYKDINKVKPQDPIGGLAVYRANILDHSDLIFIYNNWNDMLIDKYDLWAEVPTSVLDTLVPESLPGSTVTDENDVVTRLKWKERSWTIEKHDDLTKAIVSLGTLINGNLIVTDLEFSHIKTFIDDVIGISGNTINNIYVGKGIAVIKAVYNPPEEEA